MISDISGLITTQTELCTLIGVPGYEDAIADYLMSRLRDVTADVWKDPLGSVVVALVSRILAERAKAEGE